MSQDDLIKYLFLQLVHNPELVLADIAAELPDADYAQFNSNIEREVSELAQEYLCTKTVSSIMKI